MRFTLAASLVLAVLASAPGRAQQQPNFAGTWVLQNTAGNADAAQRLVVEQPLTRWLPRSPAFLTLYVERHFGDRVGVATYELEAQGMGHVELGSGDTAMQFTRHWSNRWQGRSLRMESRHSTQFVAEDVTVVSEYTETWRLDRTGRLIIDGRIDDAGRIDVRRLYYRKQPK